MNQHIDNLRAAIAEYANEQPENHGHPPIRNKKPVDTDVTIDGPPFAELCKPLSAKVMPARFAALYTNEVKARSAQRMHHPK
jgi:hypothetical protein